MLTESPSWKMQGHQKWVKKEAYRPAVAVDWYGTLYVRDHVPQSNLAALWELHDEGLDVHLLSFCGYKRSLEVEEKAKELDFPFKTITFVREKDGWEGKGQRCLNHHIEAIFDDDYQVLMDCRRKGLWVRPIPKRPQLWEHRTFQEAVEAFLKKWRSW